MKTCLLAITAVTLLSGSATAHKIDMTQKPDAALTKEVTDMKWGMFVCWSFSTFSGAERPPTKDKDASQGLVSPSRRKPATSSLPRPMPPLATACAPRKSACLDARSRNHSSTDETIPGDASFSDQLNHP
jgi:hypothetical protein